MLNQPQPAGGFENSKGEVVQEISPGTTNPFPGLRPYTTEETYLFFGREGQIDEVLQNLALNRFVAVMGFSGSGKSSLMYCGLVPTLKGGFIAAASSTWHIIPTRPGSKPIENLADSIVQYLISTNRMRHEEGDIHSAIFRSVLRSGTDGLAQVTRFIQETPGENVFFLVDQFEEIFRYRDHSEEDDTAHNESVHYVNLFMEGVAQKQLPIYSALTMRSDFLGNCSLFPGLTGLINRSNYLVPQMTRDQKRMVIEGPVAVAGGRISERLVKRLLNDAGADQDQLPILQHALMRTWDYWIANREHGEPLDLRHYNAVGKITQALSLHANEVYDELNLRGKEIAEVLFKSITERSSDNRGVRRATRLGLVAELSNASETEVVEVVEHFQATGKSFLMLSGGKDLDSDTIIELAHESLMRIWNRLGDWVEEEFESAQMYKRLSEAAAMYQIGKTGLWRPPDLQLALNWQKKQKPTRAWAQRYDIAFERAVVFLDTSRITHEAELKNQEMMQRRTLRRTRATAVILGIAAIIAILFMVFAYIQLLEAERQKDIAVRNEEEARFQERQAQIERRAADSLRGISEENRAQLEASNLALQNSFREIQAANQRALNNLNEAKHQQFIAERARENESIALDEARKNLIRAEENYEKANRLLMLTKAQAMAAKSRQEEDDNELAGLLAMQAYHFHKRYEGNKYDPYIYSGLYYSLTKLEDKAYNAIKVSGPPRNRINSLAVPSSGTQFYTAGVDGRLFKGDFLELSNQALGFANAYPNKVIALSNDDRFLINGTDSAFVQILDLSKSDARATDVTGFKGATNAIETMPDNSGFLVSSGDFSGKKSFLLTRVNPNTGDKTDVASLPAEGKCLDISPDGRTAAVGSWDGQIYMVSLSDGTVRKLLSEPSARILSVEFSPDGKVLAYGMDDLKNKRGTVKLLTLTNNQVRVFSGHQAGVFDVEFSPDGKLLASAGADRKLQMWVLDHPEDLPIVMDNNNGYIFDIAFTKNSSHLIATTSESEIRVWPTDFTALANKVCPMLTRNMTQDEWAKYVGDDIDFETTCLTVLIKDY